MPSFFLWKEKGSRFQVHRSRLMEINLEKTANRMSFRTRVRNLLKKEHAKHSTNLEP